MNVKLTQEQENIISQVLNAIKIKGIVRIGGYAGTGKTTIIQEFIKLLDNWAVCAYTGKAANILRKKGIPDASTIHSLIYVPMTDGQGNVVKDKHGSPIFILNKDIDCNGFIVDEASMVNREIYEDLRSFNKPIIFVGDHGQLEPVGSEINLMKNPDFRLEKIHRNAGDIAIFAEFVRKGYNPAAFEHRVHSNAVRFLTKQQAEKELLTPDQIICAFNKTRVSLNKRIRYAQYGVTENWPVQGEKVMCLRNCKKNGLFNGMQGVVEYLYPDKNRMVFQSDGKSYDVFFDPSYFNQESYDFSKSQRDDPIPFDFCDTITCHKAQGDEFDDVMVLEQRCSLWDFKRWAYTAASRAKVRLTWII